jgi:topoisomerase IA-like protein
MLKKNVTLGHTDIARLMGVPPPVENAQNVTIRVGVYGNYSQLQVKDHQPHFHRFHP